MKYENRLPDEGINASQENPLREFAWLLGGSVVLLVAAIVAVSWASQWLAPRIPYRHEAKLAAGLELPALPHSTSARAVQSELQVLADRLSARMAMPEGMRVRVGYRDEATINAFATLGGQMVFFRGLLARLDSEDAVAMVIAHELAHLKYRHPAAALGRGVASTILLSVLSADLGRSAASGALGQAGLMTMLSFNRDQEREADTEALRVIAAEYGHVGGALDLFASFSTLPAAQLDANVPKIEFLHTHPLTANRSAAVQTWAVAQGVALDGSRRPLPPALSAVRASAGLRNGAK
jgi:Zn-dependent protease with chaperone function